MPLDTKLIEEVRRYNKMMYKRQWALKRKEMGLFRPKCKGCRQRVKLVAGSDRCVTCEGVGVELPPAITHPCPRCDRPTLNRFNCKICIEKFERTYDLDYVGTSL